MKRFVTISFTGSHIIRNRGCRTPWCDMNEILKDKCNLLADNYMVIYNGFQFEEDQICKVAGLIYTSADRRAEAEKLTECRKILKNDQ